MPDTTYVSDYDGTMVRTDDGRFVTVYKGGALPSNADPDHVKVLLDREMVHAGEPAAGIDFDPEQVAPPFPPVEESKARKTAAAKAE
jgi:hypothetical protein